VLTKNHRRRPLCRHSQRGHGPINPPPQAANPTAATGTTKGGNDEPGSRVWTNQECALVLIDYQKEHFESIRSETPADLIELHTRAMRRAAGVIGARSGWWPSRFSS
jgi:hypothetical protein